MNRHIILFSLLFGIFSKISIAQNLPKIPFTPAFEQNVGQFEEGTFYQINTANGSIKFCQNKVVFTYVRQNATIGNQAIASQMGKETIVEGHSWEMVFDSKLNAQPIAEDKLISNFRFFGNGSTNGKKIERYKKIRYSNAFEQSDVLFYLDEQNGLFKYDIILKPGATLKNIVISYNGIESLDIDSSSQLAITTPLGIFKESRPIAHLTKENNPIDITYKVSKNQLSFVSYYSDEILNDTLIIDPAFLTWSSFFYGETKVQLYNNKSVFVNNVVTGFEMDDDGYMYILGYTNMDYKGVTKNFDSAYNKDFLVNVDFFLCKLNLKSDSILYLNFIGTSGYDYAYSLEISKIGLSLICGFTSGTKDFPTTKDAYNKNAGGCFIMGFNSNGDSILVSTFYSQYKYFLFNKALFCQPNEILVVGGSSNAYLPMTLNAFQPVFGGGDGDALIIKFSADGKNLNYASYLGGSGDELITDAVINTKGEIIIVGKTRSYDFPTVSSNKDFTTFHGFSDGFVSKFDSAFSKMEFSNLIGGTNIDIFESVAINEQEQIYISGVTYSTDFPVSIYPKAFQPKNNGLYDLVVVRLTADGKYIKNSTYLGGSHSDYYNGFNENVTQIGLNAKGEVWLIGQSASADFPVTSDAFQKTNDTLGWLKSDVTLSKLSPDLDKLLYSSYFGGKYGEIVHTNRIKRKGCVTHILFGGYTYSRNYPTTKDAFMPNPPNDTIYDTYNYIDRHRIGFASRFSDTLSIEKTNFDTSKLRCNQFLEILDGVNKGARHRWSTHDSGQYLFVTQPGTYWLEATYGCDTLRDTITIIQQFGPKTGLPLDTFICDKKAIVLDAFNDTIAATYLWNTTETTQKITVAKSGTYWVKITTANCGDITDTIHVHYITAPVLRLPKDTSICNQDSTLLIVGQNNFEKVIWQDSIQTSRFVVRQAGLYKVKTSNICGVDSANIQVDFAKSPKPFKIFRDTTICEGAEFVVKTGTPNNQETYQWENTTTQKTVSFADTMYINQSGKFVVYNSNICGSSADSFSVTYLQLPKITLDSIYNPCQGTALPLTVGKPNNQEKYLWSNNATTAVTSYNQSGNHWAQVSNLCGTAFQYFKIAFATKPKAAFNNPDVCEGQAFVLNNQSTQATGISYVWRLGDGTLDSGFAPVHTYKKTGNARTFLVSLQVASSKDCADSITLPINVNITPVASFDAAAQNKTVFFTPKNIDNQNTYKWHFGDGDSSNTKQPNHTYKADSGTYTVCLTLTNASNCSNTQCQQVHFSVGVNVLKEQGIAIYPNPTNGELIIEFSSQSATNSIFLFNTLGQQVFEKHHLSSKQSLDISHLNKGVYWVKLVVDGVVWSSKVVVY